VVFHSVALRELKSGVETGGGEDGGFAFLSIVFWFLAFAEKVLHRASISLCACTRLFNVNSSTRLGE